MTKAKKKEKNSFRYIKLVQISYQNMDGLLFILGKVEPLQAFLRYVFHYFHPKYNIMCPKSYLSSLCCDNVTHLMVNIWHLKFLNGRTDIHNKDRNGTWSTTLIFGHTYSTYGEPMQQL